MTALTFKIWAARPKEVQVLMKRKWGWLAGFNASRWILARQRKHLHSLLLHRYFQTIPNRMNQFSRPMNVLIELGNTQRSMYADCCCLRLQRSKADDDTRDQYWSSSSFSSHNHLHPLKNRGCCSRCLTWHMPNAIMERFMDYGAFDCWRNRRQPCRKLDEGALSLKSSSTGV